MKRNESPVEKNKEKTNVQDQMFNLQHSLRKINEPIQEPILNSKENQQIHIPKLGNYEQSYVSKKYLCFVIRC